MSLFSFEKPWDGIARRLAFYLVLILVLDQVTKQLVLRFLVPDEVVPVIPGMFNLTLVFNKGVAFGLLSDLDDFLRVLLLTVASIAAIIAVLYFLVYDYYHDAFAQSALGMILGGALGNIVDRLTLGHVVDFLDFYYGRYHWPSFNLADSAICVGVAVIVFRKPAVGGQAQQDEDPELPKNAMQ